MEEKITFREKCNSIIQELEHSREGLSRLAPTVFKLKFGFTDSRFVDEHIQGEQRQRVLADVAFAVKELLDNPEITYVCDDCIVVICDGKLGDIMERSKYVHEAMNDSWWLPGIESMVASVATREFIKSMIWNLDEGECCDRIRDMTAVSVMAFNVPENMYSHYLRYVREETAIKSMVSMSGAEEYYVRDALDVCCGDIESAARSINLDMECLSDIGAFGFVLEPNINDVNTDKYDIRLIGTGSVEDEFCLR